ncbi:anthranilate phosphoribosyltransferase domain protein [Mycolicibacterium hassiacum DSM 44199]|uniref:Anthranilate phosphoribosyltransferase domain protein n=1 Tax=Mycolicibacterium hassiacum (strain DSM 44199 / CIP 105218 / JCM 12690 / 3849) TaxID=1122247 RepID=K5B898_MYCHD|nr:anthranilate phosphoribosyltransferase domain protein [Mycolicibacterium hassiacum DSM 44199]
MHHQHTRPACGEHPGHHLGQISPRTPDETGPRGGRVGQRAEQVEHRGHADLTAHRAGVPVGRMEQRREREPDTHLGDAARDVLRAQVDAHPQRLEGVGTARQRRRRPVAVFDHRHARRRHHDGRHRRQVHRVRAVAAGAHHVDRGGPDPIGRHPPRMFEHGVGQFGDLRRRGTLHLHGDRERGDLSRCRRTGHHLIHRPGRLPGSKRPTSGESAENLGPREGISGSHPAIIANTQTRVEFDNYKASYLLL